MFNKIILKNIYKLGEFRKKRNTKKYWHNYFKKYLKPFDLDNKLTYTEKKQVVKKYKKYVNSVDTISYEFYKQKTGNYDLNLIPDDIYYNFVDKYYNDWNIADYFDNKCYYYMYYQDVLQPNKICYRVNGMWFDCNSNTINYDEAINLLKKNNNFFIKKAVNSEGGKGVFYVEKYDFNTNNIINTIKSDLIIQENLKQSETISKLNSSSVNSIRVLSLLDDGKVNIISCVIRMGTKDSKVDNASSGGLFCGVNLNNGYLKECAYDISGEKYYKHPITKIKFKDFAIPNFEKIIDSVKICAVKLPYFRLVSWDFALNENNNPVLLESNLKYGGIRMHYLCNGAVFGDKTNRILEKVFKK